MLMYAMFNTWLAAQSMLRWFFSTLRLYFMIWSAMSSFNTCICIKIIWYIVTNKGLVYSVYLVVMVQSWEQIQPRPFCLRDTESPKTFERSEGKIFSLLRCIGWSVSSTPEKRHLKFQTCTIDSYKGSNVTMVIVLFLTRGSWIEFYQQSFYICIEWFLNENTPGMMVVGVIQGGFACLFCFCSWNYFGNLIWGPP